MFFEAMDLYTTWDLKSNPVENSNFENNFKRTINCPATRANMNEPGKQRTYWRYVRYSTMEKLSWELLIYCYVNNITEQQ